MASGTSCLRSPVRAAGRRGSAPSSSTVVRSSRASKLRARAGRGKRRQLARAGEHARPLEEVGPGEMVGLASSGRRSIELERRASRPSALDRRPGLCPRGGRPGPDGPCRRAPGIRGDRAARWVPVSLGRPRINRRSSSDTSLAREAMVPRGPLPAPRGVEPKKRRRGIPASSVKKKASGDRPAARDRVGRSILGTTRSPGPRGTIAVELATPGLTGPRRKPRARRRFHAHPGGGGCRPAGVHGGQTHR